MKRIKISQSKWHHKNKTTRKKHTTKTKNSHSKWKDSLGDNSWQWSEKDKTLNADPNLEGNIVIWQGIARCTLSFKL